MNTISRFGFTAGLMTVALAATSSAHAIFGPNGYAKNGLELNGAVLGNGMRTNGINLPNGPFINGKASRVQNPPPPPGPSISM